MPRRTRDVSDRAVADLLSFSGSFAFAGPSGEPFFDASERAHLGDARMLLWLALVAGALSAVAVRPRPGSATAMASGVAIWRAVSRGGAAAAIGAIVVGVVGALAFGDPLHALPRARVPRRELGLRPVDPTTGPAVPARLLADRGRGARVLVVVIGALVWWLGSSRRPLTSGELGAHPMTTLHLAGFPVITSPAWLVGASLLIVSLVASLPLGVGARIDGALAIVVAASAAAILAVIIVGLWVGRAIVARARGATATEVRVLALGLPPAPETPPTSAAGELVIALTVPLVGGLLGVVLLGVEPRHRRAARDH